MLEVAQYFKIRGMRAVADYVADYIPTGKSACPTAPSSAKHLMPCLSTRTPWWPTT